MRQTTPRLLLLATITAGLLLPSTGSANLDEGWPREAVAPKARVLMYQPQLESLTEDDIAARAAVSVTLDGEDEPQFGAVWIEARLVIDRDERLVSLADITIEKVRFPEASAEDEQRLARFLEEEMESWELTDSLDRLVAALEVAEHEPPREPGLNNEAPKIVVEHEAATLVLLDGEPRRAPVTTPEAASKKGIERVVNTPSLLYVHPSKSQWYVYATGVGWYRANDSAGPYQYQRRPPKAIRALTPDEDGAEASGEVVYPKIVVATEPTELVVVFGDPEYAPLGDGSLLYVTNTDSDVIMDAASRRNYVLLSGRWFATGRLLHGPWEFVAPDELPESFTAIPPDSPKGHVRAQVAGTTEAREAVLDNLIPQTAAIRRDNASLTVIYDGAPRFEPIEGTSMRYAVNTPQSVVEVSGTYYCCDQGVWYESSSPRGPWKVCVAPAEEIYSIPATSPVHNVTYVRVYEATPDVVHVGYTPGYLGSYYSGGCVVYGTGWHYPGWYGSTYYPRPTTWGFHASYNPWTGWGFGVSWTNGPLTITIGGPVSSYPPYYSSWWGPWGYRPYYPPYYPGYRPPYYPRPPGYYPPKPPSGGTRPPIGGTRPPSSGGPVQLPADGPVARPAANLYQRPSSADRVAARPEVAARPTTRPATADRNPNNVYTDRSGNVYRRSESGWESRQGGGWNRVPSTGPTPSQPTTRPSQPTVRPSQPSSSPRPTVQPSGPSNLGRDYGARTRGTSRTRQYTSASRPTRPQPSPGTVRRR